MPRRSRTGSNHSILVVAAHPDDEVLGCAGTMARLAQEGEEVFALILGEGITSRYAHRNQTNRKKLNSLHQECRKVGTWLGIKDLFMHRLPDNRFDTVPLLKVVKIVERFVERLRPGIIYTHHPGDLNVDHGIAFRAVLTATRPVPDCPVREVYSFEIPSSTEWTFQRMGSPFRPNVFVDVSSTLETKVKAMEMYTGEVRSFPHPRSPESLRAIAARWGSVIGTRYAEAFELVRWRK
jgi:LmbE family N-acetylglucosaminyl deacetylase